VSKLESDLAIQLMAYKIPFEREVLGLIPKRKFKVDFLIRPGLVIEVQGGLRMAKGGHNTHSGITRDCEKTILLQLEGYRVFPVTAEHIASGKAINWIEQARKLK